MKIKTSKSAFTKIAFGLLFIIGYIVFLYFYAGNKFDELSLIRHGQTVAGHIIRCTEETDANDFPYHYCDYNFTLPDGRTFNAQSITTSGELAEELANLTNPYPAEIEYLAENQAINKLKNTGSTNYSNWTWHTFGAGILVMFVLVLPGMIFLVEGFKEIIKA